MDDDSYSTLESLCKKYNSFIYTAFNHRFEPGIVKFAEVAANYKLGDFYFCNMRYGNGTAIDVSNSVWKLRDEGLLLDLGSHLIDLVNFIFGENLEQIYLDESLSLEIKGFDYARLSSKNFYIEIGYVFWKSDFFIEAYYSKCMALSALVAAPGPCPHWWQHRGIGRQASDSTGTAGG